MTVLKRFVLRLFISIKYITANVVDKNNGRIVATSSTAEHAIKESLECGRTCNAKAAYVVGEVLALRLKVEGLNEGQGRGIHVNVNKEIEKKGFKSQTKVWAVVNAMRNCGLNSSLMMITMMQVILGRVINLLKIRWFISVIAGIGFSFG